MIKFLSFLKTEAKLMMVIMLINPDEVMMIESVMLVMAMMMIMMVMIMAVAVVVAKMMVAVLEMELMFYGEDDDTGDK